jgi:NAD-dependent oxidoreductase involved in siderophore biosynthesis
MLDGASLRRVRVGRLPPRERVRYYYLKMVSRASERGVERPASATPLEFAQTLDHEWPDAETDISALTEAFLAARYAPAEIQREKVMEAQEIWRRVMRALRSKIASDARKSEG